MALKAQADQIELRIQRRWTKMSHEDPDVPDTFLQSVGPAYHEYDAAPWFRITVSNRIQTL